MNLTRRILVATMSIPIIYLTLVIQCHSDDHPPNILLIVVDTLREDHLGFKGYHRNTTPNIDALANEGIVFENSYSQAGWTWSSFASIFTSLYPVDHGATDWQIPLDSSLTTLAEVLKRNGYHTYGYPCMPFLGKTNGIMQGFDHYSLAVNEHGPLHEISTSHEINRMILHDLENVVEPFLMWAHYYDPHPLYLHHQEYDFGNSEIDNYDSEIAYTDAHIGIILEEYKKRGLSNHTFIIFTSDHGEEFGDHGRTAHNTLYQEVLRTTLIVKGPGITPGRRQGNVEQIDIAPTILELAGIKRPESFEGRDLFDTRDGEDHAIYVERQRVGYPLQRAVIHNGFKLYQVIVDSAAKLQVFKKDENHLYRLESDPCEKNDIFTEKSQSFLKMEKLLNDFYSDHGRIRRDSIKLDEEDIRNLKALGYVD